jgi:kynureninase
MTRSAAPTRDPLLAWRDEFPLAARSNYLISNSLGAMPSRTRQSVQRFLDEWDQRGVRAWAEGWWTLQDDVARTIETILGVGERTVSMHQNVAVASECVLSCFSYSPPRNRIVMTELSTRPRPGGGPRSYACRATRPGSASTSSACWRRSTSGPCSCR